MLHISASLPGNAPTLQLSNSFRLADESLASLIEFSSLVDKDSSTFRFPTHFFICSSMLPSLLPKITTSVALADDSCSILLGSSIFGLCSGLSVFLWRSVSTLGSLIWSSLVGPSFRFSSPRGFTGFSWKALVPQGSFKSCRTAKRFLRLRNT